jgi:glycosyltransferase involved in cell wall biosynthesis
LLLALGRYFRTRDDVVIIVISEGLGAEWLKRQKASLALDNVIVLDFQPYAMLAEIFASADVLVAILEADAGVFSVPSKVSTYMCAKRPILLAAPPENLASRIVSATEAGIVVGPDDDGGFVEAADALLGDQHRRERYASNARRHAEATFDIEGIAERFERIFEAVVG